MRPQAPSPKTFWRVVDSLDNTDIDGDDEIVLTDAHFDRPEFTVTDRANIDADVAETIENEKI
jgi:hypothetical protein